MQAIFFKVPMNKDKAVSSQAENLSLKYCGNFMYMGQHIIGFSLNKVTIEFSLRQPCRLVGVEHE